MTGTRKRFKIKYSQMITRTVSNSAIQIKIARTTEKKIRLMRQPRNPKPI